MADLSIATKANALIISGLSVMNDLYITIADRYIRSILNRQFQDTAQTDIQYFDIGRRNRYFEEYDGHRKLVLRKWPLVSFNSLIRSPDSDSPATLVVDEDYFVYTGDRAIIQFSGSYPIPIGDRVLKATYTYGYTAVPDEIKIFGDYYAAYLAESNAINAVNAAGNALKEIEIGRYREVYMNPNTALQAKYSSYLKEMELILIEKYKLWI